MLRLERPAMAEQALLAVRNAGVPQASLALTCDVLHHVVCSGLALPCP